MRSLQQLYEKAQSLRFQTKQLDMIDQYRVALEQHQEKERDLSQEHTRLEQEQDQNLARFDQEVEKMDALAHRYTQCLNTGSEKRIMTRSATKVQMEHMPTDKEIKEQCMFGVGSFQLRHQC